MSLSYHYKKYSALYIFTLICCLLVGTYLFTKKSTLKKETPRLHIVASTGMIGDAIQHIVANSNIRVTTLMGPGVDPHLYEPTVEDARNLEQADIIFYNGLHLEGTMADIFQTLAQNRPVFAVCKGLDPEDLIQDIQTPTVKDPHFWMDPQLWKKATIYMSACLQTFDPENASLYKKNTKIYLQELEALHQYITEQIEKIPYEKRKIVTAHDAFEYYGRAYGVEVRSLQGISTAAEPALRDRIELKNFIIKHNIKVIFAEVSVTQKGIQSIIESCRLEGHNVQISDKKLYSDSMGAVGTPAGKYIGMMRENAENLREGLTK